MIAANRIAFGARSGVAALSAAVLLSGCGSLWPFGSSKPKLPDPPAVTAAAQAGLAWSTRLGAAGVGFAPAIAGGAVFAANEAGEVARLGLADGAQAWRTNVGKRLSGGVGTDGELVVVAARDGTLIALDASGRPRWTAPLGGEASTVPAVGTGVVVVRSSDNRISAFDRDTGRRRWTFQRQSPPLVLRQTAGLAVTADSVYAGLPGGRLVALNLQTGALRWEAAVSLPKGATEIERISDIAGAPVLAGRDICAVSFQGKLACVDTASGRVLWSRDVSSASGMDADERMVVVADDRGQVHAFARGGASLWRQDKLAGRELGAPVLVGSVVVVPDRHGLVHLLSRDDGAVAGRFAAEGGVDARVTGTSQVAAVQTRAGALFAISVR